jgi:hypothetical protein
MADVGYLSRRIRYAFRMRLLFVKDHGIVQLGSGGFEVPPRRLSQPRRSFCLQGGLRC